MCPCDRDDCCVDGSTRPPTAIESPERPAAWRWAPLKRPKHPTEGDSPALAGNRPGLHKKISASLPPPIGDCSSNHLDDESTKRKFRRAISNRFTPSEYQTPAIVAAISLMNEHDRPPGAQRNAATGGPSRAPDLEFGTSFLDLKIEDAG